MRLFPYISPRQRASFAKGIKSVNKQLKEQEKLAKEEAAKDAQFFEGARQTLEQTHWD